MKKIFVLLRSGCKSEKPEEVPIFEPRSSGFRNGRMTNIEMKRIKIQVGKAISILVTLKNDPIIRNDEQSIAKKI